MSSATLELYNALIEAGVDKEKAEAAARAVVSREETKEFATKSDIALLKSELTETKSHLIMWMAGFHIASLGVIAALLNQLV
jgi:hypothetical protein